MDGSQQEQPQGMVSEVVCVGSQKVTQAVADTLFPVPDKAVQVVPDGMVAVGVCGQILFLFITSPFWLFVIRFILHNSVASIYLFKKNYSHKLMWKCHRRKTKLEIGPVKNPFIKP